jgi:hypothetical protein
MGRGVLGHPVKPGDDTAGEATPANSTKAPTREPLFRHCGISHPSKTLYGAARFVVGEG